MVCLKPIQRALYAATTIAGFSFASTAQASGTMYNLYGASNTPVAAEFATDGWVWGADPISIPSNSSAATPGWAGTTCATCTPYNFVGAMAINWAAEITAPGNNLTISQLDAFNRYGQYADIDTSSGAWRDPSFPNQHGTRHSIDIGLFKSTVSQTINLTISGVTNPNSNYGISIFKGMASGSSYNHYGYPVYDSNADFLDFNETITTTTTVGNTSTTTSTTVTHLLPYVTRTLVDPITGLTSNSLSFDAEAGQVYTLMLGGNNGQLYSGYNGYQLNISSVPLPASAWMFITGMLGLFGYGSRRKR